MTGDFLLLVKYSYIKVQLIYMGFYRKYNTILKSIDNIVKLYKVSKKEAKKENKDKK